MRLYLDTNVFLSLINQEIGAHGRGLFVEAEEFMKRVIEGKHILVLSNMFFSEVLRIGKYDKEFVIEYFKNCDIKTELVNVEYKPDLSNFLRIGMHFADAFHAQIAIENKCDAIITFNTKDFMIIENKIMVIEPLFF